MEKNSGTHRKLEANTHVKSKTMKIPLHIYPATGSFLVNLGRKRQASTCSCWHLTICLSRTAGATRSWSWNYRFLAIQIKSINTTAKIWKACHCEGETPSHFAGSRIAWIQQCEQPMRKVSTFRGHGERRQIRREYEQAKKRCCSDSSEVPQRRHEISPLNWSFNCFARRTRVGRISQATFQWKNLSLSWRFSFHSFVHSICGVEHIVDKWSEITRLWADLTENLPEESGFQTTRSKDDGGGRWIWTIFTTE